ncbi:hypothetical protein FRC12_008122 [Ceratobasidium sp. 428]|nr:hypothetical protein FRC12_008122 [Ceratobasidium sp. 428]
MNPSSHHSAGCQDPAPGSSSAPHGVKQGKKRKIRDMLNDVGTTLSRGAGVFDFGPWKAALDDIGELKDAIRIASSNREIGEELVDELDQLLNDVCKCIKGTMSPAVKSSIDDFAKGVRSEIELLRGKRRQRGGVSRLGEVMKTGDEVEGCCRRVKTLLSRLSIKADVGVWQTVGEEATRRLLKILPDSPSAKYCSTEAESLGRGECTPNTRVELLEQLQAWACDDNAPKIYWLNGMAGTGKTTIAYSLCEYLQTTQKLGASFFCSQRLPECRDVNRIVPSISYRLSLFSIPFRHALASVLQDDEDAHNQPLQRQFEGLFVQPLRNTTVTFPANIVIVIDALDECDDQGGVSRVITTLLSHAAGLPVKFFVTSRPEPKIIDQMRKKRAEKVRRELRLHELNSTVVRQDIATYLTVKLAPAELSDTELNVLVQRSGVLFIYAATVVRFIEFDDFSGCKQRLRLVLDASATLTNESDEALDDLYTAILKTALERKGLTRAEKAAMETVLRHVVCAREPLSLDAMAGLIQADTTVQVSAALRPLQSVLRVSESEAIGTLHESFPNYLLNPTRSGRFYCDPGQHHAQMAQQCFTLIKIPNPPFNICNLESSYLFDDEVPGIDERVDQAISQALVYACRYWAAHIDLTDHSHDYSQLLYEFLSERLLLWMEVMNLKKKLWEGVDALHRAQNRCRVSDQPGVCVPRMVLNARQGHVCSNDLQLLVQDASMFVSMVVSGSVLRSTPHIYISALALWPKSSPVTKHYLPRLSGLVKITGTAIVRNGLTPVTLELSAKPTWELAYSSDNKHIVFVYQDSDGDSDGDSDENSNEDSDEDSDDNLDEDFDGGATVAIWNIRTGGCVASFESTQSRFTSVAFSHNGLHVILGCANGATYIWDTRTREMVGDPLRCHSANPILSVACSPDGDHIAAGSSGSNVHIWNRRTSQIIASLSGHTSGVHSVTYSPDGAYLASGSYDGTICIWSVYSSSMLGQKLTLHTSAVYSVTFSPNGTHVASGSEDGFIDIWDTRTGELIGELLTEHAEFVSSVQYSPSGSHLVSGSGDGTVCIWDLLGGRVVTRLLADRDIALINWVSYSADGTQVLACSYSGTLYIWDSNVVEADTRTCFSDPVDVNKTLDTQLDNTPNSLDVVDRVEHVDETYAPRLADNDHHEPGDLSLSFGRIPKWRVSALAFSLDGAYIVSGSHDCIVRIWDLRTGRMIGQSLKGHTDWISSVSFSPDGTHIASGSRDGTIRIWDVRTCTMLKTPLIGHTGWIQSVSYSPDSALIASGSMDSTIRIWETCTGQMVGSPLIGHTNGVNSVSYSHDGAFLVSGSDDTTVQIWNTRTGKTVGNPLKGHTHSVRSVAYSPDSLYIVSHSWDSTVCVWNAYTGSMVQQSHKPNSTNQFCTVSYSSSGVNLALSYLDQAIHISQTYTDRDLVQSFKLDHHDFLLESCVFSANGAQVASGYSNGTILVSTVHIRQVLDAEMRFYDNRPCVVQSCTCSSQCLSSGSIALA